MLNLRMPVPSSRCDSTMLLFFFPGARIQEENTVAPYFLEVEKLGQGVCDSIEGALADPLTAEPVVLDEPDHRSLVRDAVIDEVLPRPRRDHEQWQSRPMAATAKSMRVCRVESRQRGGG